MIPAESWLSFNLITWELLVHFEVNDSCKVQVKFILKEINFTKNSKCILNTVARTINVCEGVGCEGVGRCSQLHCYFVLAFILQNVQQVCPLKMKVKHLMGFWLLDRGKNILCEHLCWKYLKCDCHPWHKHICTAGPHKVNECSSLPESAIGGYFRNRWMIPILISFIFFN